MSTANNRPGARRPGAPAPAAAAGRTAGGRPTEDLDALRALPATSDEGVEVNLDPENSSAGQMMHETATIAGAKFVTQTWQRKDGSFPENSTPEVQLIISFRRDSSEEGSRAYEEKYKYGRSRDFVPTTNGMKVNARATAVKENYVPKPYKFAQAVLFLNSVKKIGGQKLIDKINAEGVGALVGLRVEVRRQKVEGMSEQAHPVLLVDFIEGLDKTGGAAGSKSSAGSTPAGKTASPAAAATAPQAKAAAASADAGNSAEIETLAEQALVDILSQAENGTVTRGQIATTLIKIDAWKTHPQRGGILKALREDSFINREGAPWTVDGNSVKLG